MRTLLAVFSGTGNTKRVAERMAEEIRKQGHAAEVVLIRKETPMPAIGEYDMLILGYPVHAFNAPKAVLKFIKTLPKTEQMPVYLLRTSGEPSKLNDASGISPRRILKRRGYAVKGEFVYVMPYNIIFRHSDGMAARMWQAVELRIPRDTKAILEGAENLKHVGPVRRAAAFAVRIEHPAMPILGKTFHASKKKCVGCGACVSLCPRGNIHMKKGRPHFGMHCVGCMACAFGCPEDAVKISLLNAWRVNGQYSFDGTPAEDEEVGRYCRKMYLRYFHESEEAHEAAPCDGSAQGKEEDPDRKFKAD